MPCTSFRQNFMRICSNSSYQKKWILSTVLSRILRQHCIKPAGRLCTQSACRFSVILPRNPLPDIQSACGISGQSAEKSDYASYAQALCSVSLEHCNKNSMFRNPAIMPLTFFRKNVIMLFMAIPHKDCATDASSNFSSDETKSGVNT